MLTPAAPPSFLPGEQKGRDHQARARLSATNPGLVVEAAGLRLAGRRRRLKRRLIPVGRLAARHLGRCRLGGRGRAGPRRAAGRAGYPRVAEQPLALGALVLQLGLAGRAVLEVLFGQPAAGGAGALVAQLAEERLLLKGARVRLLHRIARAQHQVKRQARHVEAGKEHEDDEYRQDLQRRVAGAVADVAVDPDDDAQPEQQRPDAADNACQDCQLFSHYHLPLVLWNRLLRIISRLIPFVPSLGRTRETLAWLRPDAPINWVLHHVKAKGAAPPHRAVPRQRHARRYSLRRRRPRALRREGRLRRLRYPRRGGRSRG